MPELTIGQCLILVYLDRTEFQGETISVTPARPPRERPERVEQEEIALHRIAISNLPADVSWQVCGV